jgi:hypothetical protein
MIEDYKAFAIQDASRKKDESFKEDYQRDEQPRRNFADPHQAEEERRRMYNLELKRQIEEKEASKRNYRAQEKVEEYFPFGKPGAGAPFRDQSGKIIAARPPRFDPNDPNFNRRPARVEFGQGQNPGYSGQPYPAYQPSQPSYGYGNNNPSNPPYNGYTQGNQVPNYNPNLQNNPPPNYNQGMQMQPNPQNNRDYPPPNYPPANLPRSYQLEPEPFHSSSNPPVHYEERPDPRLEFEKLGEVNKKAELQRALQEQIDEKKRRQEEEKRKILLEERYEEERLARERQQMEEEFRKEAEKKKKQIEDLNSFNTQNKSSVVVLEPKKGRRPRTPIDLPPPEPTQFKAPVTEDLKRRGQSALTRSPVPAYPLQTGDIPQEYISFLNSQLDKKLNEFKADYKVQEIRQQEEMLRLRQRDQMYNEQNIEAQREIERLKDELRRKQLEDDIRHRELTLALQARPNPLPATRLPPYEPKPVILAKGLEDASLSLDFAQKSLVGESKFIPLPNPTEPFPIKPQSPKEKRALHLDSIFPSLPDSSSNYDTFRSASSSLGVDNLLRKNEERLKALDKINPEAKDELNKLDEILFKFAENKEKDGKNEGGNRVVSGFASNGRDAPVKRMGSAEKFFENDRSFEYNRKIDTPVLYGNGEYLPSIKELDGEGTYSLPDAGKGMYGIY